MSPPGPPEPVSSSQPGGGVTVGSAPVARCPLPVAGLGRDGESASLPPAPGAPRDAPASASAACRAPQPREAGCPRAPLDWEAPPPPSLRGARGASSPREAFGPQLSAVARSVRLARRRAARLALKHYREMPASRAGGPGTALAPGLGSERRGLLFLKPPRGQARPPARPLASSASACQVLASGTFCLGRWERLWTRRRCREPAPPSRARARAPAARRGSPPRGAAFSNGTGRGAVPGVSSAGT